MKPQCIRKVETEETKSIGAQAFAALNDSTLTDDQADLVVMECNGRLTALGMPVGGLMASRAAYRAAYPSLQI